MAQLASSKRRKRSAYHYSLFLTVLPAVVDLIAIRAFYRALFPTPAACAQGPVEFYQLQVQECLPAHLIPHLRVARWRLRGRRRRVVGLLFFLSLSLNIVLYEKSNKLPARELRAEQLLQPRRRVPHRVLDARTNTRKLH